MLNNENSDTKIMYFRLFSKNCIDNNNFDESKEDMRHSKFAAVFGSTVCVGLLWIRNRIPNKDKH